NVVSYRSGPANWVNARRRITLRDRDERSSLAIHVCFLRETGSSGSTTRNMEETGVLEKVNLSGFCYLALNQVTECGSYAQIERQTGSPSDQEPGSPQRVSWAFRSNAVTLIVCLPPPT